LLFRLLARSLSLLFALSRAERSLHGERESNTRVLCQNLCTSAFLCGLCLVQGSEFEPVPLLVGISPCFATITGLRMDPCLYRSLCFSCVVLK
jgi:hypothetical protein